MKFKDFTLLGGQIHSDRVHDTTSLVPNAVQVAGQMLQTLKRGKMSVGHGIAGLPPFWAALGLPETLERGVYEISQHTGDRLSAPGRFFRVCEPGAVDDPFQISLVLPFREVEGDPDDDLDKRSVATLVAISAAGGAKLPWETREETIETLWAERPFLASVILPATENMETVQIAADFATCFAAAMLKDMRQ